MRLFRRPESSPIGLEIGADGVKLLQALTNDDGRPAIAAARQPLSPSPLPENKSPAWRQRIRSGAECARSMLAEGTFAGRRVVAALPDELVQIRTVRIEHAADGGMPSLDEVRREAGSLFPFDLTDAHFQYLHAGQTRRGSECRHEVIAAACPTRAIAAFVAELDRVGLGVAGIDIAPCALYRGIEWNSGDPHAVHAVIEMGPEQARVILGQGQSIRFIKAINVGTTQLREAVARRLGITQEEASQLRRRLIDSSEVVRPEREPVRNAVRQACRAVLEIFAGEVVPCLRYHSVCFRGPQPQSVLLVGAEAGDGQICSVLSSAIGLAVIPANPFAGFDLSRLGPNEQRVIMSDWAMVLGLALREMPRPATGAQENRSVGPVTTIPAKSVAA
jgi:type IV pilus assembly protein PilM